jgi:hypothetical protein
MTRLVTVMLAAQLAMLAGASVRVEHDGEELDLSPHKIKPPPEPRPETIYLPTPRQEHNAKSKALVRMLKSKGRK